MAFGRYHAYDRHTFTSAPATIKQGATSPPLTCSGVHQTAFGGMQLCHVRQHFVEWADEYSLKHPGVLDIGNTTKYVAAAEWPSYRYLVHVDGQTASSRLFQLLVSNEDQCMLPCPKSVFYCYVISRVISLGTPGAGSRHWHRQIPLHA